MEFIELSAEYEDWIMECEDWKVGVDSGFCNLYCRLETALCGVWLKCSVGAVLECSLRV